MGRRVRRGILHAALALWLAPAASVVPAHAAQGGPAIAPRDALAITVFGEAALTGKYIVDPDGTFEFPLIGRVPAAGLSVRDLEIDLTRRLGDGYLRSPQVTVALEQLANVQIFVMGEVRSPGAFQFAGGVTLLEALARAGSTTPGAAREVVVIRPDDGRRDGPSLPEGDGDDEREVIRVDLAELQAGGLARHNVALRDGDTVFVPRAQLVYITGQVRSPGAYTIQPGTTVLQALSLAGGVTDRGATGRIRIIRVTGGENGEDEETREIRVRLTDPVEPGDTIVVPERFF